nr:RING finger and transmembrane domain-containing protein 2 isoform X3 [Macaca fascicularis]
MWLFTVNQVLRKMQRRHSSNTDNIPPERNRSQTLSSEASVDEGGVFESLKAEAASPPALFSGLSGSLPTSSFPSSLVLGSSAGGGDVFIQMPASREEGGGRGEGGAYHHRQPHHHFHHGGHRGGSLLQHVGGEHRGHSEEGGDEQPGTPAPALSELKAVICWLQKGLPFILILLAKLCFQHKLGIAVCIGMASTFAYANSTLREQVSLKEKRSVLVILWILAFLAGNTLYVLYTFSSQQLYNSLIFLKPNLETLDFFDLLWIVGIADFVLKYITIALKCLIVALPKIILAVKSKIFIGHHRVPSPTHGMGFCRPGVSRSKLTVWWACCRQGSSHARALWENREGTPKPAPSRVFLKKVTSELSFKGGLGVTWTLQSHKGTAGRGDSRSHSAEVKNSSGCAFFQITPEHPVPTRL